MASLKRTKYSITKVRQPPAFTNQELVNVSTKIVHGLAQTPSYASSFEGGPKNIFADTNAVMMFSSNTIMNMTINGTDVPSYITTTDPFALPFPPVVNSFTWSSNKALNVADVSIETWRYETNPINTKSLGHFVDQDTTWHFQDLNSTGAIEVFIIESFPSVSNEVQVAMITRAFAGLDINFIEIRDAVTALGLSANKFTNGGYSINDTTAPVNVFIRSSQEIKAMFSITMPQA
jgi:hypothetical protein